MPEPSKRDQLVDATKELLWEVGYEAMSPRDIQARSAAKPDRLDHHFPAKLANRGGGVGQGCGGGVVRSWHIASLRCGDSAAIEGIA
jgi:hypothetical protein